MGNRYQSEIDDFEEKFKKYKNKNIILYGIGRMTVTLLENNPGFRFVGLLDKDIENIGKEVSGVKILSVDEAVELGDLVIINTSGTYWNTIARRIDNIGLPIFYKNGIEYSRLNREEKDDSNPCWMTNVNKIKESIVLADAVIFDFFDTLFIRKTVLPDDVVKYIARQFMDKTKTDYYRVRKNCLSKMDENYELDDLYIEIKKETEWTIETVEEIKRAELLLEEELLEPRKDVIGLLSYAMSNAKTVYIMSDMYLPKTFFVTMLRHIGIELDEKQILISCEYKASKRNKELWIQFINKHDEYKNVVCIGDDLICDIANPTSVSNKYVTHWLANPVKLAEMSSISAISSSAITMEADAILGMIFARIFNSPFSVSKSKGRVVIDDFYTMGYVVYGPVILEFCRWLRKQATLDRVDELLFVARDGYFLMPAFQLYVEKCGLNISSKYLAISRQLAMMVCISETDDLVDYAICPYSGTVSDLVEDRFSVVDKAFDNIANTSELEKEIRGNMEISDCLWDRIYEVQKNYRKYLEKMEIAGNASVVDTGYYGTNQQYLNRFLGTNLSGYYMVANLDDSNPNMKKNTMKACFQSEMDKKASNSNVFNKMLYMETFLTAPYGMIMSVNGAGEFECKKPVSNQFFFSVRKIIFDGVKNFINDYVKLYEKFDLDLDVSFCDEWFGMCFSEMVEYSEEIKSKLYYDNAFSTRFDNNLFA